MQTSAEMTKDTTDAQIRAGVEIMLSGVREIPHHLIAGMELTHNLGPRLHSPITRVTLCAMGGSAFPGELLKVVCLEEDTRFSISRGYRVARGSLSDQDLVIASSFSGNTEETLSALEDASSRGAQTLLICAGGQLEELALKREIPIIKLERPSPDFQPRAASGFMLGALAGVLEEIGLLPHARSRVERISSELRALMRVDVQSEVERIVSSIIDRIPVLYAPPPYAESLARIAKIKINENAKSPAFWNEIPEFNHNEMVGYTRLHDPLVAVFFTDPEATSRMQRRIERSIETLRRYEVETLVVPIRPAKDRLAGLLATLYLFDLVSCELAVRAGVDPNPVQMIEEFKVALGPYQP